MKRHEHVQFNEFLMMDFYKYRLLGHKPSQHGPKASENLGSALELQDTQAAPKPGVYCGTLCTERALVAPLLPLKTCTLAMQWLANFIITGLEVEGKWLGVFSQH